LIVAITAGAFAPLRGRRGARTGARIFRHRPSFLEQPPHLQKWIRRKNMTRVICSAPERMIRRFHSADCLHKVLALFDFA
jgi:hypothetical protein